MREHFHFRPWLWGGLFALAAVATGLAIHRLYTAARQEIIAEGERALRQEEARVVSRVREYTDEVRRATMAKLASFHVDGLGQTLRQWDEANETVLAVFQWEPAGGFVLQSGSPAGPLPEGMSGLWQEFREWRSQHLADKVRESGRWGTWQVRACRTQGGDFPAGSDLGYQEENLDILRHAGGVADPWAGWAGNEADREAAWIFWYQAGPGAAVRGCLVDGRRVVAELSGEIADKAYARLNFVPAAAGDAALVALPGLPGCALRAEPGDIFREKESRTRLTAWATALLFGLFLIGVCLVVLQTRRESRDARRKITFVTQVSHELRTPLTSIRMFADMLAGPDVPEAKRIKFAGTISAESARLGGLIERLLAFNALEKNGKKITGVALDVGAVVQETVDEMAATLRAAGLAVEFGPPDSPVLAWGDHSALKQALLNLLDNAVKYARSGGIVRIGIETAAGAVLVRVADAGPGVPAAIRARAFEPFVQGGQTLTNKAPGVGLGLSLARGLLRQAGAELVLIDAGPGATFEIRLPRAASV